MKINCTSELHDDNIASMEVYESGGFCFSCGYFDSEVIGGAPREKEDIDATIRYIRNLPCREIRGLQLPYDYGGFFIEWPSNDFYKKRVFGGQSRYLGPKGHRAPLFLLSSQNTSRIYIVEGELNALSLKQVTDGYIVSPGSANEMLRHLDTYLTLGHVFAIFVDKDKPGVINGLKLKDELVKRGKMVILEALEEDFNDKLQKGTLQDWCSRMGMSKRL